MYELAVRQKSHCKKLKGRQMRTLSVDALERRPVHHSMLALIAVRPGAQKFFQ